MKIFRTKNKYLNLFDLSVIIIGFVVIFVLAFLFLRRSKNIEIVVKITSQNVLTSWDTPPSWFSTYFKKGMTVKDSLGRDLAKIKNVYEYDTGPNNKAVYLTMDFKADYSGVKNQYSYEGKPLLIGAPIKIEFPNILAEGLVTYMQGVEDTRKPKTLIVQTRIMNTDFIFPETNGVNAYVADAINVGEEIKDSYGKTLITILDKGVEPAQKVVTDSAGNVFVRSDPLKKDVYLKLRLEIKETNNAINKSEYYLFDNVRVNIGEVIPLHLKDISVYPIVTKIIKIN